MQRDITHEAEVETRMRQAQKMEAIGTLAGGIAHDFNNILGGIVGFTDMALLYAEPGSEVHGNLLHIRQGGRRAADLVQQILTFSRQSAAEKVPVLIARSSARASSCCAPACRRPLPSTSSSPAPTCACWPRRCRFSRSS